MCGQCPSLYRPLPVLQFPRRRRLAPGHGFHGNYASFNLKNRPEVIHVNMDKFPAIQEQLAAKIRSAGAGGEGEAVPLHIVFPSTGPIELWDSGRAVAAMRRHAANAGGGVSCAGLGGGPDQSEAGERRADRRRAHRRAAIPRPQCGAESGAGRCAGPGRERHAEPG